MDATGILAAHINSYKPAIGKVVDYNAPTDKLYRFNLTATNDELSAGLVADTVAFGHWIDKKLSDNRCRYGIGGYMEHRTIYTRSVLFDTADEPRRLHLGVDIWGVAGIPVYSPLPGEIHSFADNDHFGDYGPTIILKHKLNGLTLYSLYGHLSRGSLVGLAMGQNIECNQQIATLGIPDENGGWPPHLHFQLMLDIGDAKGDYPGVGKFSEKEKYSKNIPDPELLLGFKTGQVIFV